MWHLFKTELSYNRNIFLVLAGLSILLPIVSTGLSEYDIEFLLPVITFVLVNNLQSSRSLERRDLQQALLPLPNSRVAAVRTLLQAVGCYGTFLLYGLVRSPFLPVSFEAFRHLMVMASGVLLACSLLVAGMDVLGGRSGGAQRAMMMSLVLLLGGLAVLGAVVFALTESSGSPPELLRILVTSAVKSNPFAGFAGNILFIVLSLAVSGLTVLTYSRRRSYVDGGCS